LALATDFAFSAGVAAGAAILPVGLKIYAVRRLALATAVLVATAGDLDLVVDARVDRRGSVAAGREEGCERSHPKKGAVFHRHDSNLRVRRAAFPPGGDDFAR